MTPHHQRIALGLSTILPAIILLAIATISNGQTLNQSVCADEKVIVEGCNPTPEYCKEHCELFGTTYLKDKCCVHSGVNANLLAFEESETWIPRIEEYGKCTGANIRLQYLAEGEDGMGDALIQDVGENNDDTTGQGIYDAYIVQAPWLPPVFKGLKSLSEYIKNNDEFIDFMDIVSVLIVLQIICLYFYLFIYLDTSCAHVTFALHTFTHIYIYRTLHPVVQLASRVRYVLYP